MNDRNRTTSDFLNTSYACFNLLLKNVLRKSLFVKTCISLVLITLSAMASAAVTLTVPSATLTTGSYDVSWSGGQGTTRLFENDVVVATTSRSGIYSPSPAKSSGLYRYYVEDCATMQPCVRTGTQSVQVTLPTAPAAPPSVSAAGSGTSVFISWTAPTGPVTAYNIQRLDGGLSTSTTSTNYTDATVNLATNYTYRVQACNSLGCSGWTNSNVVNVSSVPTSLLNVPPSDDDGTYTITWNGARTSAELYESTGSLICTGGVSGGCTVSGKVAGTYSYYLNDCYQAPVSGSVRTCNPTASQNVVVIAPAAPASISGSVSGPAILVTWSGVAGATSYNLYRSGLLTSGNITSFLDTTASFGVPTTYSVVACKGTSCSGTITSVGVTIPVVPPVPSSISASVSGTSIVVSWGAASGATNYELLRNGGVFTSGNFTGSTDTSAAPGTQYTYSVRACNGTGCSGWLTSSGATVPPIPAAPASISATVSGASIVVSWGGASGATSYELLRNGGVFTSGNFTGSTDTSAVPGTQYTYSVRACNGTGCSAWVSSSGATVPPIPAQPASVTATVSALNIMVNWGASSGATSYELQRNSAGLTSGNITSFTDTTGVVGTAYTYSARACNGTGCSAWTTSSSATIPVIPAAPASISAIAGSTSIAVSWSPSSGTTSYQLEKNLAPLTSVSVTTYTDTSVAASTAYAYRVKACNGTGCSGWVASATVYLPVSFSVTVNNNDGNFTLAWSGIRTFSRLYQSPGATLVTSAGQTGSYSASGKAAGTYTYYLQDCFQAPVQGSVESCTNSPDLVVTVVAPPAPASISATVSGASVVVSWGASSGATKYELQRNNVTIVSPTTTTYTDTAVSFGVLTTYKVRACKGTSCSAWVTATGVTVPPIPAVPASISATISGPSVPVTWGASSGATRYELQRNSVALTSGNFVSFTDASAVPGTAYTYRVKACNATGCSATWASSSSVTVPPIPAIPAAMSATVNLSSIFIQWSVSSGATTYQFDRSPVFNPSLPAQNITLYTDTSIVNGTSYTYSVRACNGTGCSAPKTLPAKVAGAVVSGAAVGETYDYDPLGRLTKVNVGGAVKTDYQYDKAGNRTTVTE